MIEEGGTIMSTVTTRIINGYPCVVPNKVIPGDGFYISYNDYDIEIYGVDTTALVDDDMLSFYILNGDHRENYIRLIPKGYTACLNYFRDNKDKINKRSDLI
jgi:hypothetical protein